jgi:ATP-dependent helicase/nuclease subunit A
MSIRQRTPSQLSASAPEASVWVSANAGTGKTGVLVDRISRLLLSGVHPEQILCLTFTKAAAAEMANRLSALLSSWSAMEPVELEQELRALGEDPVDEERISRAQQLFAMTLEAPEGLRIRTIHSFCESLLGRFPLEAHITPDFRVMDERDQMELQREARDHVLNAADAHGTDLTDALRALAALVDEAAFAGLIKELDSNRGKFRSALARHNGPDGLVSEVYDALGIKPGLSITDVLVEVSALDQNQRGDIDRLCAAWDQGSPTNQKSATAIRDWLTQSTEQRAENWRATFAGTFLTQKGEVKAERTLLSKDAQVADPQALDIAFAFGDACVEVLDTLKAINVADASKALISIGAALIESYEEIKLQRGRLDYDDLIERASGLLNSPSGVSWVHYKLDGGIEHVLVDEAQDTSPDQWRVVEEITSEFYAGAGRHEDVAEMARTMFAVGDEKQSIYSFQGADPAMFGEMRDRFGERAKAVERMWRSVEMAQSFRSSEAILDVVDAVFDSEEARQGLSFDGRKIEHLSARTGQAGRVTLWSKEEPQEDDGEDVPWDVPVDYLPVDSPEGRVAARIAGTIKGWIDNDVILPAQGRPVRPGDVLILVQKRRQFAQLMVAALKQASIPVAGRDRMILPEQLVVQDLIALGRLTLLPDDDLNTATVLKGPLVGLDEDALFDLAHGRDGLLIDALRERQNERDDFSAAWHKISIWRARAGFMQPFEFFALILRGEHGEKALLRALGPDAAEPIEDFLSAAIDYERDHVPSLEGFLHWLQTGASEVKRDLEQGRNEVRVMTVHGAKGLQSEIVFLADACSVPAAQTDDKISWFGDQQIPIWPVVSENHTTALKALKKERRQATIEEYRRLLYVAMTRAKDQLYITGFTGKRTAAKETSWYDMVAEAIEPLGESAIEDHGQESIIFEKTQSSDPDGQALPEDAFLLASPIPDWAVTAPRAEPLPPKPLSPSRPDDEEPPIRSPLSSDDENRFKRGLAVHVLMQTIPDLEPDKRVSAVKKYLARPGHGFSADLQDKITNEVMALFDDPTLSVLFGLNSQAEVPIVGTIETPAGPRVVSGQIDRLVDTGSEILIIDYKTNRPAPTDPAKVPEVYLRQMATYRAALQMIFENREVRPVLLWTDGPKWMELQDKLLGPHAP